MDCYFHKMIMLLIEIFCLSYLFYIKNAGVDIHKFFNIKNLVFFFGHKNFNIIKKIFYIYEIFMKRITINHLRVIKNFANKTGNHKVSDYEKFLSSYVSMPTARKIIKELIEFKMVSVKKSNTDLRVKYLEITDTDIEKYIL